MPEEAKPDAPAAAGGPLSGWKGWVVVLGALTVEALFFGVLIWYKDVPPDKTEKTGEIPSSGPTSEDLQRTIGIKGLTYTIHTPGQGSATLAMSVELELGVTPAERERKTAPTDVEMERIRGIVDSYINRVKDHLNTFIPSLGVGVLQGPNGQRYIKDEIRRFINDGLKEMYIKDLPAKVNRERITQVLLTEYQWQQDG